FRSSVDQLHSSRRKGSEWSKRSFQITSQVRHGWVQNSSHAEHRVFRLREQETDFRGREPRVRRKSVQLSRTQSFSQVLLECVDEGLSVLGNEPRQAVYQYLSTIHSLDREQIPDKVDEFATGLTCVSPRSLTRWTGIPFDLPFRSSSKMLSRSGTFKATLSWPSSIHDFHQLCKWLRASSAADTAA